MTTKSGIETAKAAMDTKQITAVETNRAGWSIVWASGFQSAMPNEQAAKLCAAAPDLLAACERVLASIEWSAPDQRMSCEERVSVLTAAIAKAKAQA